MELTLIDTPTFHRAKKQCHPIIYLDRHLGVGWFTVYSSNKSHVAVKLLSSQEKTRLSSSASSPTRKFHTIKAA